MASQIQAMAISKFEELTYANGACLINQGVWNCVWMPFAVKYGRRPVLIKQAPFA
jgi:hypothetical protein